MEVESVLVTGANRGIGLEFVRQLVELPKPPRFVFAAYRDRNTVEALKKIRDASKETQVILTKMDIRQADQIESARKIIEDMVGDKGLNLLINNAAALRWVGFPEITEEDLLFHFSTNTVGQVMVLKAALNMAMRVVALTVKETGILVVNMCPGWVKTDMGTEKAHIEVTESISSMLKALAQLDESHHGTFLDRNGKTIPF